MIEGTHLKFLIIYEKKKKLLLIGGVKNKQCMGLQ